MSVDGEIKSRDSVTRPGRFHRKHLSSRESDHLLQPATIVGNLLAMGLKQSQYNVKEIGHLGAAGKREEVDFSPQRD